MCSCGSAKHLRVTLLFQLCVIAKEVYFSGFHEKVLLSFFCNNALGLRPSTEDSMTPARSLRGCHSETGGITNRFRLAMNSYMVVCVQRGERDRETHRPVESFIFINVCLAASYANRCQ